MQLIPVALVAGFVTDSTYVRAQPPVPMASADGGTSRAGHSQSRIVWSDDEGHLIIRAGIRNLSQTGLYRIHATCGGKTSEASLFVRPQWEWYADAVRRLIAKYPPRHGP